MSVAVAQAQPPRRCHCHCSHCSGFPAARCIGGCEPCSVGPQPVSLLQLSAMLFSSVLVQPLASALGLEDESEGCTLTACRVKMICTALHAQCIISTVPSSCASARVMIVMHLTRLLTFGAGILTVARRVAFWQGYASSLGNSSRDSSNASLHSKSSGVQSSRSSSASQRIRALLRRSSAPAGEFQVRHHTEILFGCTCRKHGGAQSSPTLHNPVCPTSMTRRPHLQQTPVHMK